MAVSSSVDIFMANYKTSEYISKCKISSVKHLIQNLSMKSNEYDNQKTINENQFLSVYKNFVCTA